MTYSKFKELSTEDKYNWLRARYKKDLERIVRDIHNDELYLYLDYRYFKDMTDKEIEMYVLKTISGWLEADPTAWPCLKEEGFINTVGEACACGYEAVDLLHEPIRESKKALKYSEFMELDTKDKYNWFRTSYKKDLENLIRDFHNNEPYLYLEYEYFENMTDKEIEMYVLKPLVHWLEDDPRAWIYLKEDGLANTFMEACAHGYETSNLLPESKKAWKNNNTLRKFVR